ncbi:hypothetical protein [Candidatus Uabimicrobium amorphum]|uniref:Uncharacterized protein n=1 Tax=Uabimicrobium amorphum TaxID=2596890 RepID=A0A5S9IMX4_UABAM|nr:hypothetical protein [Candidatus Uabimicrobium amorphum]BBM84467.1 hypothetical protein UABAM_02828 [Candidatus Uabimicrobium amorphum]
MQKDVPEENNELPEKWNDVLEDAWKNHKNGYDREKFYRLYSDSFWTPEDEENYQMEVASQTIDTKSGDYTIPVLANVPIADPQPTYADKKEEFEKQYPILTTQEVENWIRKSLPGFAMKTQKLIAKHFGGSEQEFCEYFSRHLIPAYKYRGSFSPKIAMIKIRDKEEFCFV